MMPTGPLGIIYSKAQHEQPWYDQLSGPAVFPAYHVVASLARSAGLKLVDAQSSDSTRVQTLACRGKGGTTLWLANLTAENQPVKLSGAPGIPFGTTLDEDSFVAATTDPRHFQKSWKALEHSLTLKPFAVAVVSIND
jgi:D-apionolactonase